MVILNDHFYQERKNTSLNSPYIDMVNSEKNNKKNKSHVLIMKICAVYQLIISAPLSIQLIVLRLL